SLASGIIPSCIVLNVTIRSMKLHGGGFSTGGGARPNKSEISLENIDAVRKGSATNLRRHIRNLKSTKIPIIVSINKFSTDTIGEIDALTNEAKKAGANAVVLFEGHSKGGIGAIDLADAVVAACNDYNHANSPYVPIVDPTLDVRQKILKIATNVYGAQTVDFSPEAIRTLNTIEKWNKNTLPVCMAKNQYSFSHDKKILGAPDGFIMPIRELRINAGAGFIVAVCGSMMTMPGLPSRPAALDMDMDEDGNLIGVFG
ncbi:MAG: formate--tetrahydrofolate ligase, partial [Candidatus Poseidoniales archaeon]